MDNQETNIVGISLAKYDSDDQDWNGQIDLDQGKVKISAGKTFLDLMNIIRPHNYFLPT